VVAVVVQAGIVAVVVGIGMAMYRMVKGPHVADRVLAGDVLSLQVVALVILLAVDQRRAVSLDVALLVAIVGFASTLAFAQYIGAARGGLQPRDPDDGRVG
jgi:multicomponent K+:H+ antiporter subunit F|tara:strand:- start:5161 stop:5463 length:303 start_codon:yes stop_codon:yes gene_type:complete